MTGTGRSRQDLLAAFVPALTLHLAEPGRSTHATIDGSMLSADISGFTALSERHSAKGRIGAEQLSEIMSACFTGLIDAVTAYGGDVLKFGGDALLVLFRGGHHERRAAAAGTAMQRSLGQSAPAVRAALTMSVGVGDGPFDVFVAGTQRQELLVTGAAADRVVRLESAARAGETLVSPTIARHVPADRRLDHRDDGVVIHTDHTIDATATATGDDLSPNRLAGDPEPFVPPTVVSQLDAFAELGGEHRHATVGFLMVSGVDAIAGRSRSAAARELGGVIDAVHSTCTRLGVAPLETDISPDGFKFVLSAGAPITRGHNSDTLLRAALEIVRHETPLELRVGVQCGPVFAGFIGHPNRWTYSMTGDCMSTAARMLGLAGDRDVIAVDDVMLDTRFPFSSERLQPVKVKGKSEAISAHRVLRRDQGDITGRLARPESAPANELIGRDSELEFGASVLATAGGRLAIVGASGFGTTSLLDALVERCARDSIDGGDHDDGSVMVIRVSVYPDDGIDPYVALREPMRLLIGISSTDGDAAATTLRRVVDDSASRLADLIPLIGNVVGVDVADTDRTSNIDETFRRDRTIDAVVDLLGAIDLPSTTILAIDGAQWLDESSMQLLSALVAAQRIDWRIVVTSRPDDTWVAPDAAETLRLGPLADDDISRLAIARSRRALSDADVRAVTERSAGNPHFAIELVDALAAGSAVTLPESLERLIAIRIDALEPIARRVLRFAAVIGNEFDEATLTVVLGAIDHRRIDRLLQDELGDFVTTSGHGRWRFVQSIHREVAYEGLPFRERRRLHALAGECVEAAVTGEVDVSAVASTLSIHWMRAGHAERAWRFAVMAGDRAARLSATGDAIAAYQRALEAAGRTRSVTPRQRSRIAVKLGDVAEIAGQYDLAASAYQRARRLLGSDDPDQVPLFRKRGVVHEREGHYSQAIRWYERGIEATERLDHAEEHERLELEVAIAGVRFRQGRYETASSAAAVIADDLAAPPVIRLRACYIAHVAIQYLGDRDRREHYGDLGVALAASVDEPVLEANLTNNLGIASYFDGDWERAAALYDESFEHREKAGDLVGSVTSLNNLGELRSDQRRFDEARDLFEHALRRATAAGYEMAIHVIRANLGRLATREGRTEEARSILERARDTFERMGAVGFALEARLRLIEVDAPEHLDADAIASLLADSARDGGGALVEAPARRLLSTSSRQRCDLDAARAEIDRALSTAREARLDAEVANCLDELAQIELASGVESDAAERAQEIRERLGMR